MNKLDTIKAGLTADAIALVGVLRSLECGEITYRDQYYRVWEWLPGAGRLKHGHGVFDEEEREWSWGYSVYGLEVVADCWPKAERRFLRAVKKKCKQVDRVVARYKPRDFLLPPHAGLNRRIALVLVGLAVGYGLAATIDRRNPIKICREALLSWGQAVEEQAELPPRDEIPF